MPVTKPSVVPIWTQGNTAQRTQPTNGEQFAGFVPNFRPPAKWHNWLFGIFSDWIQWLDYVSGGLFPVSNAGHNILTDTTLQGQLDQADAFLSSLQVKEIGITVTGNPLIWELSENPVNSFPPQVFIVGVKQTIGVNFTYAIVSNVGTVTFISGSQPSVGQECTADGLTATIPGAGGVAVNGGYVTYGDYGVAVIFAAAGLTITTDQRQAYWVISAGGAVSIAGSPLKITAGSKIGQELLISGTDNTDYPILEGTFGDGSGVVTNGPISLKKGIQVSLIWSASQAAWVEDYRSN